MPDILQERPKINMLGNRSTYNNVVQKEGHSKRHSKGVFAYPLEAVKEQSTGRVP